MNASNSFQLSRLKDTGLRQYDGFILFVILAKACFHEAFAILILINKFRREDQ